MEGKRRSSSTASKASKRHKNERVQKALSLLYIVLHPKSPPQEKKKIFHIATSIFPIYFRSSRYHLDGPFHSVPNLLPIVGFTQFQPVIFHRVTLLLFCSQILIPLFIMVPWDLTIERRKIYTLMHNLTTRCHKKFQNFAFADSV